MSRLHVEPGGALRGEIVVPGDKSVSHRALLFGALAEGQTVVRGLLRSGDVRSTWGAVEALGVDVLDHGDEIHVLGRGALREPDDVIDCGNSGTTMRLLTGILAGEPGFAVLTGDGSLRRRPMGRLVRPLRAMGARIDGRTDGDRAPLAIRGGLLSPFEHVLPVASAQMKSALMLATRREGAVVTEPGQSRDHTERLLTAMGAEVSRDGDTVRLAPIDRLHALAIDVPGDLSSAAFWLVAGSIVPGSELVLRGVGINPTRAGVLEALQAMGADVEVHPVQAGGGEPVADLVVRHAMLRGTRIDGDVALRALDELPVLAVAAAFAEGETTIADAEELRVKESDRILRTAEGLRALGVDVVEHPDGMTIQGGAPRGPARVDASGDHRLVMAFAVAGAAAPGGVTVDGAQEVATSYPAFPQTLADVGASVERA